MLEDYFQASVKLNPYAILVNSHLLAFESLLNKGVSISQKCHFIKHCLNNRALFCNMDVIDM